MTRRLIETLVLGLLTLAAIGCAGSLPEMRHGRAAGEWQVRLPSTPSTFGKLALGTGGNAQPATVREPDATQLLAANKPAAKKHASSRIPQPSAPAVTAETAPASPSPEPMLIAKQAEAPTQLASNTEPNPGQRYAQREADSRKLQEFRGGDAIIISASALVIVLLIVVLILLLR